MPALASVAISATSADFIADFLLKVGQASLPVSSLSSATLPRRNHHFAFTALGNTKKRQVLIVSSPRPQRKQAQRSLLFRQISIPETTHQMIVHHSCRLHEGITNG